MINSLLVFFFRGEKIFYTEYTILIYVLHVREDWFRSQGLRRPDPARIEKASIFLCCLVSCFLSDVYVLDESRSCFELDKVLSIDISKYSV